jgi:hypothetical protein
MLKPLGMEIERKKLKTFYKLRKGMLGLVVTPWAIRVQRRTRRKVRGIAYQVRKTLGAGIIVSNDYSHQMAGRMRKLIPESEAKKKGSQMAALAGFMSYIIGIDRPMKQKTI